MRAGIIGVGSYIPEKVLSNADLEKMMDTNDEWITSRTGIKERRIAGDDMDTVDMAIAAGRQAVENAGLHPEAIDFIITATVTQSQRFPSVSNYVQAALDCSKAAGMDVEAACSGFMFAMITAKHFIEAGTYQNILVIGVDKLSKATDWNDRGTAVLFGDGAGAVVISKVRAERGILGFELGSDGKGAPHLFENDAHHIIMNGREVFKFAVRQLGESAVNVLAKSGLNQKDLDLLIPHQANIRIMEAARERLNLPAEKMITTIHKYGNTGAASIPVALKEALDSGKIEDGYHILMVGFGGGLTWGAVLICWGR